jgi:hypothetical protein
LEEKVKTVGNGRGELKVGHYCIICNEIKANEKFSGKGHRRHICKNCSKKGTQYLNEFKESQRRVQHYINNVKSISMLYIEGEQYSIFKYKDSIYVAEGEQEELGDVYFYIKKENEFLYSEEFSKSWDIREALLKRYYDMVDNSQYVDYEELVEIGACILTKRQRKYEYIFYAIYQTMHEQT